MTLNKLAFLGLPAGELLPGFLIPIFESVDQKYIQCIDSSNKISKFEPVLSDELSLDFQTLELTSALNIVKTEKALSLGIGSDPIHAFTDLENIYIGTQDYFLSLHTLALFEEQMNERLKDYPFTLASLYDFVRKPDVAIRLREDGSTKSLFMQEKKLNVEIERRDLPKNNHHQSVSETHFPRVSNTNHISNDAQAFAQQISRNRNNYASTKNPSLRV